MEKLYVYTFILLVSCVFNADSLDSVDVYDNLWQPYHKQPNWQPQHRQPNPRDAYSGDINKCLFSSWTKHKRNIMPVLSSKIDCSDSSRYSQLCYSPQPSSKQALFAVCYDKVNLIPVLTGHIVKPAKGKGRPADFRTDRGKYAPHPQAAVNDYNATKQEQRYPDFNEKQNYYCAKGHLTPNADFGDDEKRAETFILTNAAPQWQRFNEGNWLSVEAAVRDYVHSNSTMVYVFTGTGGIAKDNRHHPYKLNDRVQAPKYYWKAVCDPAIQQSIVFVGINSVGSKSTNKTAACNGQEQSEESGVVFCDSLENIKNKRDYSDFLLPPFYDPSCKTSQKGTFLDPFIKFR